MNTRFWVAYSTHFPNIVKKPDCLLLQIPSFQLNPLFTKANWHEIKNRDYTIEKI